MVASTPQKWDEAVSCFEQAIALNRRYELPFDEARCLYEWGVMCLERNDASDREAARQRLGDALAIFRRVGARKKVAQIEAQSIMWE